MDLLQDYVKDKFDIIEKEYYLIKDKLESIDKTLIKHDALLTNHITDSNKAVNNRLSNIEDKLDQLVNKK